MDYYTNFTSLSCPFDRAVPGAFMASSESTFSMPVTFSWNVGVRSPTTAAELARPIDVLIDFHYSRNNEHFAQSPSFRSRCESVLADMEIELCAV
jgi:hypothetical protein